MRQENFDTALIVDASFPVRNALKRLLIDSGLRRVLVADTAPEAITLMGEELVDLVLTPWEPRGLEGAELLKALPNRGRNRNVPVVLLDDGLSQPIIVAAIKAGVAGRLPLPATAEQLAEILRTIRGARLPGGRSGPE